jgi:hypothetical protein
MRFKKLFAGMTVGLSLLTLTTLIVSLQSAEAQSDPKDQTFARLRETQTKLGPNAVLSGGVRNLFALARNWDGIKAELARTSAANAEAFIMSVLMPGLVSAPPALLQTRLRHFTANESSAAWCGNNVVVGFNDTESVDESGSGAATALIG